VAQATTETSGEAVEAISGPEQAASRGEEAGEAIRPTEAAGEVLCLVIKVPCG
jgi:hypothetical protein